MRAEYRRESTLAHRSRLSMESRVTPGNFGKLFNIAQVSSWQKRTGSASHLSLFGKINIAFVNPKSDLGSYLQIVDQIAEGVPPPFSKRSWKNLQFVW